MLRRVIAFIVLATLTAACVSGSEADSTTTTTEPASATSTTEVTGTTAGAGESTTTTSLDLSGLEGLPLGVRQQLEELVIEAQEIRGLDFLEAPNIVVVSDSELMERVTAIIDEESEDLPADEALYKLLGLLDPAVDLENLLLDLYGEQVAGFYDGDTGEIVVPSREDGMTILQQSTMVHEMVHALTDQHFDYMTHWDAMLEEDRLDEATAYQALGEGDASWAQVQWLQGLSQGELGQFFAESLELDFTVLESAPQFIQDSLAFPYEDGLAFVQQLYESGGWHAVNEAYTTMPALPGSSEQIITPDDYERDLPQDVTVTPIEVPGYALERTSKWGELGFRLMLDQVVGEEASTPAADGWGGDYYHQWFDGINAALLIVFSGDTAADVEELRLALLDYANTAVAEEDFVWVDEDGGLLYFIAADEVAVGEQIRDTFGLN